MAGRPKTCRTVKKPWRTVEMLDECDDLPRSALREHPEEGCADSDRGASGDDRDHAPYAESWFSSH